MDQYGNVHDRISREASDAAASQQQQQQQQPPPPLVPLNNDVSPELIAAITDRVKKECKLPFMLTTHEASGLIRIIRSGRASQANCFSRCQDDDDDGLPNAATTSTVDKIQFYFLPATLRSSYLHSAVPGESGQTAIIPASANRRNDAFSSCALTSTTDRPSRRSSASKTTFVYRPTYLLDHGIISCGPEMGPAFRQRGKSDAEVGSVPSRPCQACRRRIYAQEESRHYSFQDGGLLRNACP